MKKTLTKTKFERKETSTEFDFIETPVFVQNWNFRQIIGIYPEAYDYTFSQMPSINRTGFIYHVYVGVMDSGSPTVLQYINLPDWSIKEIYSKPETSTKSPEASLLNIIIDIIIREDEAFVKISEETFREYYSKYKDEIELFPDKEKEMVQIPSNQLDKVYSIMLKYQELLGSTPLEEDEHAVFGEVFKILKKHDELL